MCFTGQHFLRLVYWLARKTTPRKGPQLDPENRPKWRKIDPIDTGYGYSVDKWPVQIRLFDWILNRLSIKDGVPSINAEEIYSSFSDVQDRLPPESTRPNNLADFLWNMTGSYFLQSIDKYESNYELEDELENELDELDEDIYVVDLSEYEDFEVRPGCERYGGKVFMKDGQIINYEYLGNQYPADDPFLDKIIRSTLCLKLMVELHALRVHLCTAQRKVLEYHNKYDENSPYIDFLYLATHGILEVTRRIAILVGPHGLVARLFALTNDSYLKLLNNTLNRPELRMDEYITHEDCEWNEQITIYRKAIYKFVSKLSEIANGDQTEEENRKEIEDLTDFYVASTALHNLFGDNQIYSMVISGFFLPKVYTEKPGYISQMDYDLLKTLLVAVSPRVPLIIDAECENVFRNRRHKRAWRRLIRNIKKTKDEKWFDPNYFEISVGF